MLEVQVINRGSPQPRTRIIQTDLNFATLNRRFFFGQLLQNHQQSLLFLNASVETQQTALASKGGELYADTASSARGAGKKNLNFYRHSQPAAANLPGQAG
ncbi:MAG: hypothetical protein CSA53_00670 [Gammaproteobacteria bacterium]|nr:MAG: hypothetical protein CSA53_00670 [Gammaproteobacteria bacterium]